MENGEVRTGETKQGLVKKILWGTGVALLVVGMILTVVTKGKPLELLSPLSLRLKPTKAPEKLPIVGFLPTWELGKTITYGAEIDQLVFSGVEVSEDGSLIWDLQSKKLNSDDYINLKNNITQTGGKNILGIKLFVDKKFDKLIASDSARQKLYTEVRDVEVAGNFDGVNIDFEYMSNPIRILDDDFTAFLAGARTSGWKDMSVDVFANTMIKGNKEGLDYISARFQL